MYIVGGLVKVHAGFVIYQTREKKEGETRDLYFAYSNVLLSRISTIT